MPAHMKKCCRCEVNKSVAEFGKRSRNKDGLEYYCMECKKIEGNLYRDRANELARGRKRPPRSLPRPEKAPPKTWDDVLERTKLRKQKYKDKYKEEYKKWSSSDRGKLLNALKTQRYRARKSNTINTLTETDVAMVLIFQGKVCAKCGKSFDQVKYEIDHVVPVSLGGDTVLENIQLLCRSCNASKKAKIIRYIPEITETIKQSLGDLLCPL